MKSGAFSLLFNYLLKFMFFLVAHAVVGQGDYKNLTYDCNDFKATHSTAIDLKLEIDPDNYRQLVLDRKKALEKCETFRKSEMYNQNFQYVKIKVHYKNKIYDAKIRLKGDRNIHFLDPVKWSFKVIIDGEKGLEGLKKFSLNIPVSRNYVYEDLFHGLLKKQNLICQNYTTARVQLNGMDLGVYSLEHAYDAYWYEINDLIESPVFKLDESAVAVKNNFMRAPLKLYNENYWWDKDPQLVKQALTKFENWRNGKAKFDEVFNVEKMADYFALCNVYLYFHGAIWKSLRFYFNPQTQKFEPVGFDGHYNQKWIYPMLFTESHKTIFNNYWVATDYADWWRLLFNDPSKTSPDFIINYISRINYQINSKNFNKLMSGENGLIKNRLSEYCSNGYIGEDSLGLSSPNQPFSFTTNAFIESINYIKAVIRNDKIFNVQIIPVHQKEDSLIIQMVNLHSFPFILENISTELGEFVFENNMIFPLNPKQTVNNVAEYRIPKFNGKMSPKSITARFVVPGTEIRFERTCNDWQKYPGKENDHLSAYLNHFSNDSVTIEVINNFERDIIIFGIQIGDSIIKSKESIELKPNLSNPLYQNFTFYTENNSPSDNYSKKVKVKVLYGVGGYKEMQFQKVIPWPRFPE